MPSSSIIVSQNQEQLNDLRRENNLLQVAMGVADPSGRPSFNVVYTSKYIAPTITTPLTTEYGINWTTDLPPRGARVNCGGNWTSCRPGQSFSIATTGILEPAYDDPWANPNLLNISKNSYDRPVNIVIGIKDESSTWRPIWVAQNQLLPGAHGGYQPLQSVRLWYQPGELSATIILDPPAPTVTKNDLQNGSQWYFRYETQTGRWLNQGNPF